MYQVKALFWTRIKSLVLFTGKSFSEGFILVSVKPQYDKKIVHWFTTSYPEKYKFRTCCVQKLFFVFVLAFKTTYSEFVFFWVRSCKSMYNLSSYCCPIHVVTFTLISNLATDYIQKRTGRAHLFSFEYNLSPNLISK